ncbi:hypothetical protein [Curtobacterium sp. NPDC089991]|uniref:hypothetical protein n=1 Tax=Curtobacterium sp. NPDC089991 TaxID=3363969 RepID=UPI00382B0DB1
MTFVFVLDPMMLHPDTDVSIFGIAANARSWQGFFRLIEFPILVDPGRVRGVESRVDDHVVGNGRRWVRFGRDRRASCQQR